MKIIDLSAGNRAMWFDKHNPIVTFIDIRPDVEPDIIADSGNLNMLPSNHYDLAVFDPPHANVGANSAMSHTYGHHTAVEIRDIISKTAIEAYRLLKQDGLLCFKWSTHDQKLETVLTLFIGFEPLFGQRVSLRKKPTHSGIESNRISATYWVMLRKKM